MPKTRSKAVYDIKIAGGMVSLIRQGGKSRPIFMRRLVSPTFISVWYSVKNDEFDRERWDTLPIDEKMYLSKITTLAKIDNKDLSVANASLVHDVHERLKLIEGAVVAGNLNRALVEEYLQLVDKLAESGSITNMMGSHMKRVITNRYANLLSQV